MQKAKSKSQKKDAKRQGKEEKTNKARTFVRFLFGILPNNRGKRQKVQKKRKKTQKKRSKSLAYIT
jgi:hypothetical protein